MNKYIVTGYDNERREATKESLSEVCGQMMSNNYVFIQVENFAGFGSLLRKTLYEIKIIEDYYCCE